MVIFISNPELIPLIQSKVYPSLVFVFNLTSLYSGYNSITELAINMGRIMEPGIPINEFIDSVQFDKRYYDMIFHDDYLFATFMKVITNLYQGHTVVILVQRDPYRDAIMESLIKLIQQRYGYNSWVVDDVDDLEAVVSHIQQFTPTGIMNMDFDIRRFDELTLAAISQREFDNRSRECYRYMDAMSFKRGG